MTLGYLNGHVFDYVIQGFGFKFGKCHDVHDSYDPIVDHEHNGP